jgi:hypothetical protein
MQFAFWESVGDVDEHAEAAACCPRIGKAGEYIAAAELEIAGYSCSIASEGLQYDLLVADPDGCIHRVQVKTVSEAKSWGYCFYGGAGKSGGLCDYRHVDVFAFVALDQRAVLFVRAEQIGTRSTTILHRRFSNANVRALSIEQAFGALEREAGGG